MNFPPLFKEIGMGKTLEEMMSQLPKERQAKIEAMAAELIAEEMSLRELRQELNLTQEHLAQKLGINQESVSRTEKRTDLMLSTVRNHIEALGGELQLLVHLPNRPPITLKEFSTVISTTPSQATQKTAKGKPVSRNSKNKKR
jgi:DNA-binding XRE family transcriptional regulator